MITIDKALTDRNLLGAALKDLGPWSTWLAVLRAAFGLPIDEEQRATFRSVAGDRGPPTKRVRELWSVVGRRGGKSRMAAALAVYAACFTKHRLAAGEVATCWCSLGLSGFLCEAVSIMRARSAL